MAISREILERRLLESRKIVSKQLETITTRAAGDYEKANEKVVMPHWIKFGTTGEERPELLQRNFLEEISVRTIWVAYLKDIVSAIDKGDIVTFQERLETLKYLHQEHLKIKYNNFDLIVQELLQVIHRKTELYAGCPLNKAEIYFASELYQQHMAMLLLLIEYGQGSTLKRLLERGEDAIDYRESDYQMKLPKETRVFAEGALEGIEKDIKKQKELVQPASQPVGLLPGFQKDQKIAVEKSIQSQAISLEEQLFRTVERGDLAQVRELLETPKSIDINFSMKDSREGDTPLICALNLENLGIAQLLLEKGADPWKKNNIGHSALHALMMVHQKVDEPKFKSMTELLNILLSDKNIQQEINVAALPDGRTPYALAICYPAFAQTKVLLEELTKAGGKYGSHRSYWAACLSADEPLLKLKYMEKLFPEEFTTQKLQKKSSYFENKNALEAAVNQNDVETAQYIFEKDKKGWQEVINQKPSLLHQIFNAPFSENRPKMVEFFLAEGADPHVENNLGKTIFNRLDIWEERLRKERERFSTSSESYASRALDAIGKEFKALEAIKELLKPKVRLKNS